jgi:hypothetical protein
MKFALLDLFLGVAFFACVFASVMNRETRWGIAPIALAIVCGVTLASRYRKRNKTL